jgi:Flp pilus assembly protein TadG
MKINDRKGASAIEFAIILPVLVLLLFGALEYGLLIYNQQVITNACREGTRAGITGAADTDIVQIVRNYCDGRLMTWADGTWHITDDNPPNVTTSGVGGAFPDDLTVTVEYIHNFLVAGIIGFDQKALKNTTVMKME